MKKIIRHENGNLKVITINEETTRTQQQFKDQCDVNNIMKKYRLTGELNHINKKQGIYADLSDSPTYQAALEIIIKAENTFSELSSDVRKRFNNDPHEMISFLENPQNNEEAIKLGLKIPPPNPSQKQNETQNETKTKTQKTQPTQTEST